MRAASRAGDGRADLLDPQAVIYVGIDVISTRASGQPADLFIFAGYVRVQRQP
jgi:hypothetical protein